MSKPLPSIIVFDGIIAAGKTTLINKLVEQLTGKSLTVTVIPEPVDEWVKSGILERFYTDKERWGYFFQTKAFLDRVRIIREYIEKYSDTTDIFLLERSPDSDKIFMKALYESKFIDELEWKTYKEWCDEWVRILPRTPTHSVYIKVDVEEAMSRIRQRNRDSEELIPIEYQEQLSRIHDDTFLVDTLLMGDGSVKVPSIIIQSGDYSIETLLKFIQS